MTLTPNAMSPWIYLRSHLVGQDGELEGSQKVSELAPSLGSPEMQHGLVKGLWTWVQIPSQVITVTPQVTQPSVPQFPHL